MRLLLVEDDEQLAEQLSRALDKAGHAVSHAADGDTALDKGTGQTFDVLLLDRMIPGPDGLTVLQELRRRGVNTPAIILSALGQVDDRVEGLRSGADDYLPKPFAMSELLARLEVVGRRAERREQETQLVIADLRIDRLGRKVFRGEEEIVLQPREYRLLEYLARNEGNLITRTMLLQQVWDLNFDPQTNVIDVHMSRLRAKIDKGFEPQLIHTIRGRGYRFGVEG